MGYPRAENWCIGLVDESVTTIKKALTMLGQVETQKSPTHNESGYVD